MKKREISHWAQGDHFEGMLLFAQTLEESTFHYSYESYKLPALNCHFLCYDIMHTARDIDRKVLMDGNFVPLAEEFEQMVDEDFFVKSQVSTSGTLLFVKDKSANFYNLSESDLKTKIKRYPEVAEFVRDICEVDDNFYLACLIKCVVDNIFVDTFTFENGDQIYKATRMIVTELVNGGYSKEYIYSTVNDFFYNPLSPIICAKETIEAFFECFSFEKTGYQAIFGVNSKAAFTLGRLEQVKVRNPSPDEKRMLNLQRGTDCVVTLKVKAVDPVSAFKKANNAIDTIQSLHKINQHNDALYITKTAIISKGLEDGSFEEGALIQSPQNPMKKKGNAPDVHALFDDITLLDEIDPPPAFFRAISLHHGALESQDISNQLLNLWTIIEILIDTKRDNEDRINTICSTMCSVLNRRYLYAHFEQLLRDIEGCSGCNFAKIIKDNEFVDENLDSVEKFALVLSLKELSSVRDKIKNELSEYPLLKYRVTYFSDHVLVDSKSIFEYLKRHEKRIRWHIMRIYRNRIAYALSEHYRREFALLC